MFQPDLAQSEDDLSRGINNLEKKLHEQVLYVTIKAILKRFFLFVQGHAYEYLTCLLPLMHNLWWPLVKWQCIFFYRGDFSGGL